MVEKAVILENVSKSFKIYHERHDSIFELIRNIHSKNPYEKIDVLNNVTFSVDQGHVLGILGLNGSGKSTLLRIISKILHPDKGKVIINGKIIPFLELGTGFNPEAIARDNIIQYGIILGFSKKDMETKLDRILQFAELKKFEYTKLKNFSSGMLARIAFSTAIEVNPDILLLDEVLSVGDIHFQQKSFDALMSIKNCGKTIILVSHSLEFIEKFCDTALILHEGKVIEYGNVINIITKYKELVNKIYNQ